MDYKEAENLLEEGSPKSCINYFKKNGNVLEWAYSLVMLGKLKEAEKVIYPLDSVRADWVKKLIPLLEGRVEGTPTYFQIRNFLEIDMTMLIKSGQYAYVNNLLKFADMFQGINNESFKMFGRCLLKNNYFAECKVFLDRSLNEFYSDVELHYLFAEYYIALGNKEFTKKAVENCLRINPEYYPAKRKYEELKG